MSNIPFGMFPCYQNVNINAQIIFADVNCFLITNTRLPLKGAFRIDTFDFQITLLHFRTPWLPFARHSLPKSTLPLRLKLPTSQIISERRRPTATKSSSVLLFTLQSGCLWTAELRTVTFKPTRIRHFRLNLPLTCLLQPK